MDVPNAQLHAAFGAAHYLQFEEAEKKTAEDICALKQDSLERTEWCAFLVFSSVFLGFYRFQLFSSVNEGDLPDQFPAVAKFVADRVDAAMGTLQSLDEVIQCAEVLGAKRLCQYYAEKASAACLDDDTCDIVGIRRLIEADLEPVVALIAPDTSYLPFLSEGNWLQAMDNLDEFKSPLF